MLGIDERALRIVWTIFLFGLILAVVYYIRATLLLFSAAIFLAYMLSPVVVLVERFLPRKRRGLALAVVYFLLVGLLVLIGIQLIPALIGEATNLLTRLPGLVSGGGLAQLKLPHWLEPMRAQVIATLNSYASNLGSKALPFLRETGSRILTGLGAVLPGILVPILAFFFLKDGPELRCALIGSVDEGHDRNTMELIVDDIHDVLRKYTRSLVLLAIAAFLAWLVFLNLMHYPYGLLLAGTSALLEFIPVIGPAAALVIICAVLIVTGTGGLIWAIVFWGAFRVFQDYVLNPYLMSSGIELHPLLVLFGVLAGERIGGVPGMFFSIPAIAILRVVFLRLRAVYESKRLRTSARIA